MPFPNARVIPASWSRHHQPVASGGMGAACVITDPARLTPGAWDNTAGAYGPPTPFVVLPTDVADEDGWLCRVQRLLGEQDSEQAGQESTVRQYLVQLDDPNLSTLPPIEVGYVLELVSAPNDPQLVGVRMSVIDVQHGSERFTRDLIVEHNQQPAST